MLKVRNLTTTFDVENHTVTAVDNISFDVPKNQIIGIAGESGSGKSVTTLSILNLLPPNGHIDSGTINWHDQDLRTCSSREWAKIRGSEIGLIFQNPQAALNPVFRVGNQIIETIQQHQPVTRKEAETIGIDLLRKVQIPDPEIRFWDYPHQFSGGMCQRIMIAMTLALKPKLLIADEPTSALDVTIQAQIMTLLCQLKDEFDMSILLISHDLGILAQYSDHLLIMYLGKIVEEGAPHDIFHSPKHPYTQALINAIPSLDKPITPAQSLSGDIPSPINLPSGCRFHPRCPHVMPKCTESEPALKSNGSQKVACFLE